MTTGIIMLALLLDLLCLEELVITGRVVMDWGVLNGKLYL